MVFIPFSNKNKKQQKTKTKNTKNWADSRSGTESIQEEPRAFVVPESEKVLYEKKFLIFKNFKETTTTKEQP